MFFYILHHTICIQILMYSNGYMRTQDVKTFSQLLHLSTSDLHSFSYVIKWTFEDSSRGCCSRFCVSWCCVTGRFPMFFVISKKLIAIHWERSLVFLGTGTKDTRNSALRWLWVRLNMLSRAIEGSDWTEQPISAQILYTFCHNSLDEAAK